MASTSSHNAPQAAPWREAFLSHLKQMDSPEFVFSTLHSTTTPSLPSNTPSNKAAPNQPAAPTPYVPRARYCIFRGFWAELPENKHNNADRNAEVYSSDCPTLTTDVRMHKAPELFNSSAGRADDEGLVLGSGGGGPCEAVWWAKSAMVQWRMKGEAFIVAGDIEGDEGEKESSGVRTVKGEVGKRMRIVKDEGKEGWSWKKELRAHFGNLSPGMRGTFAAPPPGQPVSEPYDDKNLKLGQKIEDLDEPISRGNFRVVIIRPQQVESVDLSDPATSRRQVYTYDDASGEWSHQECWP